MSALATAYGGDPAAAVSTSSRLGASGAVLVTPGDPWPEPVRKAHRESVARLTASLGTERTIVVPIDALDEHGAWWEIDPGTGDTRSVGDLGLHRARVPYNPNYELPQKGKSVQQNPYGNQKSYESPAARGERQAANRKAAYDSRRAAQERKAAENAAKRRTNDLNKSARKRGGTGYTVLVVLIMMAGAAAHIAVGVAVSYCTYVAVEALVAE